MTTRSDDATLVRSAIEVGAPPEVAFDVFANGINRWWSPEHHVLGGALEEVGVEPRVGGRLWERNDAGDECAWGRVLTWDPPREFAFSWLLGPGFAVPGPDAPGSRVTVTFEPTATGTLVTLVHDQLDAHGPGWEQLRDGVGSDLGTNGGWPYLLRRFAAAV